VPVPVLAALVDAEKEPQQRRRRRRRSILVA